jgi:predicted secreted protein
MREFLRKLLTGQGTRDCRSKRVILVPHCALNQNARVAGAAERPSAITELIAGLMQRGLGIIQMPCAELRTLGLSREEIDIRGELQKPPGRSACRRLAVELVDEIEQYRKSGVTVVGIIGKNGSPACGVEETWSNGFAPGTGVFIEELESELRNRNVAMNMTGTRDDTPAETLAAVDRWVAGLD